MIDASAYWNEGASAYERWWVPVLEQACNGLLDRLEREVPDWRAQPCTVLDLGTGTGLLAVGAVRRWPNARVVGMDPARGMLQLARQRAEAAGVAGARISWAEGSAEAILSGDSAFDAVVSSFVYQFLVDRPRALREIHRVLKPGGTFAFVTWMAGPIPFMAADEAFEAVLGELGLEWEGTDSPPGRRPTSPQAAARELRANGFVNVRAREVTLLHRYDRHTYLDQLEEDDAPVTFAKVDANTRNEIRTRTHRRWQQLGEDAFVMRRRLVSVLAAKP